MRSVPWYEPPKQLLPEVERFLEVVLGEVPPLDDALDRARQLSPLAAELVEPLLSLTLSPTMIRCLAAAKRDPSEVPRSRSTVACCRDRHRRRWRRCCGPLLVDGDWELEWIPEDQAGGTVSPGRYRPMWRALETVGGAARAWRTPSRR